MKTLDDNIVRCLEETEETLTVKEIWRWIGRICVASTIRFRLVALEREGRVARVRHGGGDPSLPSLWKAAP